MPGYVIGRCKRKTKSNRDQIEAFKIFFPLTKKVWFITHEELKEKFRKGDLPEIVGLKITETIRMNQNSIVVASTSGLYSAVKTDNINGNGEPIDAEGNVIKPFMWNLIGVQGFQEFRKFVCVNSMCEIKIFTIDEVKDLLEKQQINGIKSMRNQLLVKKSCSRQIYKNQ